MRDIILFGHYSGMCIDNLEYMIFFQLEHTFVQKINNQGQQLLIVDEIVHYVY